MVTSGAQRCSSFRSYRSQTHTHVCTLTLTLTITHTHMHMHMQHTHARTHAHTHTHIPVKNDFPFRATNWADSLMVSSSRTDRPSGTWTYKHTRMQCGGCLRARVCMCVCVCTRAVHACHMSNSQFPSTNHAHIQTHTTNARGRMCIQPPTHSHIHKHTYTHTHTHENVHTHM